MLVTLFVLFNLLSAFPDVDHVNCDGSTAYGNCNNIFADDVSGCTVMSQTPAAYTAGVDMEVEAGSVFDISLPSWSRKLIKVSGGSLSGEPGNCAGMAFDVTASSISFTAPDEAGSYTLQIVGANSYGTVSRQQATIVVTEAADYCADSPAEGYARCAPDTAKYMDIIAAMGQDCLPVLTDPPAELDADTCECMKKFSSVSEANDVFGLDLTTCALSEGGSKSTACDWQLCESGAWSTVSPETTGPETTASTDYPQCVIGANNMEEVTEELGAECAAMLLNPPDDGLTPEVCSCYLKYESVPEANEDFGYNIFTCAATAGGEYSLGQEWEMCLMQQCSATYPACILDDAALATITAIVGTTCTDLLTTAVVTGDPFTDEECECLDEFDSLSQATAAFGSSVESCALVVDGDVSVACDWYQCRKQLSLEEYDNGSDDGLSTGVIVGIVIGGLVGLVLCGGAVFYFMSRSKSNEGLYEPMNDGNWN